MDSFCEIVKVALEKHYVPMMKNWRIIHVKTQNLNY